MRAASLVIGLVLSSLGSADAAEVRYNTEYSVSLGILPIARLSFETEVDGGRYTIGGHFRSSGLVDIVKEISAKSSVSGQVDGQRFQPDRYQLEYKDGRKTSTYDVKYRAGSVVETVVEPKPKPRPDTWVPIADGDLKAVLDPIGAFLIPGDADVCSQTLAVYDGESRMDLVLSPKRTEGYSAGKLKGEAVVCGVKYVPKSGYRKGRKDIEYLRSVEGMEIWFAKTATLKLYAPVYARVPTRYGTIYVSAQKFDG